MNKTKYRLVVLSVVTKVLAILSGVIALFGLYFGNTILAEAGICIAGGLALFSMGCKFVSGWNPFIEGENKNDS